MSSQSKYMENCPKGAMRHFNGDHLPEGTREMNSLCWSKFNFSGQHVLIHRVLVFASLSGILSDAIEHCYSRYNHGEYIFWLLWSKRIEQYSLYLDVSFLAIVDGFWLLPAFHQLSGVTVSAEVDRFILRVTHQNQTTSLKKLLFLQLRLTHCVNIKDSSFLVWFADFFSWVDFSQMARGSLIEEMPSS